MARRLIVNADDLGMSSGVNRGIAEAHERGIVTSASFMVRGAAAGEAAAYGRRATALSIGLHFDLGEWRRSGDGWRPVYEVVPRDDAAAVREELFRQLEEFRRWLGREPTHLDSHQHLHRYEPVRSAMLEASLALGIVLRGCDPEVRHLGCFYGQCSNGDPWPDGISVERLLEILRGLEPGTTELACHPGDDSELDSAYGRERSIERQTLCDPRVRDATAAEGIRLCGFAARPAASI